MNNIRINYCPDIFYFTQLINSPNVAIMTKNCYMHLVQSAKCFEISLKKLDFDLCIHYNDYGMTEL